MTAVTALRTPDDRFAAFRIPASTAQLRHLSAAAIGHLHTDKTVPRADRDSAGIYSEQRL